MTATTGAGTRPRRWTRLLARWEVLLLVALLGLVILGGQVLTGVIYGVATALVGA